MKPSRPTVVLSAKEAEALLRKSLAINQGANVVIVTAPPKDRIKYPSIGW